jgi:hypothetical protein
LATKPPAAAEGPDTAGAAVPARRRAASQSNPIVLKDSHNFERGRALYWRWNSHRIDRCSLHNSGMRGLLAPACSSRLATSTLMRGTTGIILCATMLCSFCCESVPMRVPRFVSSLHEPATRNGCRTGQRVSHPYGGSPCSSLPSPPSPMLFASVRGDESCFAVSPSPARRVVCLLLQRRRRLREKQLFSVVS